MSIALVLPVTFDRECQKRKLKVNCKMRMNTYSHRVRVLILACKLPKVRTTDRVNQLYTLIYCLKVGL